MLNVSIEPLVHQYLREYPKHHLRSKLWSPCPFNCSPKKLVFHGRSFFCDFKHPRPLVVNANAAAIVETFQSTNLLFKETFPLEQKLVVKGRVFIRLDHGKDERHWQLTVGCNLPGKWILHWGVSYMDDVGAEWDQPPKGMRPPASVRIKDYAMETPLKKSSSCFGGNSFQEVEIKIDPKSAIAAIHFVLKDEKTGSWYQHRGRDFKVPLTKDLQADGNIVGAKKKFGLWPGSLGKLSSIFIKPEDSHSKYQERTSEFKDNEQENNIIEGFYEELPISKENIIKNSVTVSVKKSPETAESLVYIETDLPGDVVVHWGVCRADAKRWEIPSAPYPPDTVIFKDKALRTLLRPKENANGCWGLFSLEGGLEAFLFVLKLNENTWLKCMGTDFYIPLSSSSILKAPFEQEKSKGSPENEESSLIAYTYGIINDIRNLVSDSSFENKQKTKTKEAQESILQEIEKLAAEAYSIFRSSTLTFREEAVSESVSDSKVPKPPVKISSGTGSGYEILCQGFNWESHKSGKWYMELKERAKELSSLGFTVIWLPPPTESVSPEGYMPKDLYNLNSRYGNIEELKDIVKKFHDVGIKVLGDVVLNHRCAHYQNQNGVWNIFGGRLNWDDRAVVADDPHFQGGGNKSSGDNFHAAPNIDHSQDFVRKDIKEWLCWLREEIGYDGWRLDFVRGFWGGYVKDYIDASEPYFSVGEYWDSLSYTYGEMDHNQDAHRQRIIDWINASNGTAGAFDVSTKGILHSVLERCEYWRLSDQKGKPPGVVGWWPSRAVTFIENHDTGSTQGHWRFPGGKEMQGYAYILTHPGTPTVFYDHIFSHCRSEIAALIDIRNRNKINCRSKIQIKKAERDVYAAIIDEKVAMKIGPGSYEPPSGPQRWSVATEGRDYKVWEAS